MQVNVGPGEIINAQHTALQPSITVQFQAKQADVQALSELTRVLDKKVYILHLVMYQLQIFFSPGRILL